jgi:hypothetical protein
MKLKIILVFLLVVPCWCFPQEQLEPSRDIEANFNWYTNGWGVGFAHRFYGKNERTSKGYSLGLATLRHPQEIKIANREFINSGTYTYGKLNRVFTLHTDFSLKIHSIKPNLGNVNIFHEIKFGALFAGIRPVYVFAYDETDPNSIQIREVKYNEFLHENAELINSDAGWYRGLDEINWMPGFSVSWNTGFIWNQDIYFQSLSIGCKIQFFQTPLEILINKKQHYTAAINIQAVIGKTSLK